MGLVQAIGVSNWHPNHFAALSMSGYSASESDWPSVNQIEFNPVAHDSNLLQFCQKHGVHLMAYGSLASQRGRAGVGHLAALQRIAQVHKATVVQIALAWAVQQGVAVIPGSSSESHLQENLAVGGTTVARLQLSGEEMKSITTSDHATQRTVYDKLWQAMRKMP